MAHSHVEYDCCDYEENHHEDLEKETSDDDLLACFNCPLSRDHDARAAAHNEERDNISADKRRREPSYWNNGVSFTLEMAHETAKCHVYRCREECRCQKDEDALGDIGL